MSEAEIPIKTVPISIPVENRIALFLKEAARWAGVHEMGGNNRGQIVEMFLQHSGLGPGNPWCMAFVQFCRQNVDSIIESLGIEDSLSRMPKGAHCLTIWNESPPELKSDKPSVGAVVIWKHKGSSAGHTGIVTAVDGDSYQTLEGNTSPGPGIDRDGDGVFKKTHALKPSPTASMELVGFIQPWGKV